MKPNKIEAIENILRLMGEYNFNIYHKTISLLKENACKQYLKVV